MTRAALTIAGNRLAVSGVLDFESVLVIDTQGQDWLTTTSPAQCELDLGGVGYSSSVGVALVLGWLRAAIRANKTLIVKNLPTDMAALARVGGLEKLLSPS
ncbi:MAG TPA: STAS domain-containing protein [Spongiibacteraceae bacterium]|jgi:phospholipid transport system transporter-binding protein